MVLSGNGWVGGGVTPSNLWFGKITGGYTEGMAGCGGAAGVGWNGAGATDMECHEHRTC